MSKKTKGQQSVSERLELRPFVQKISQGKSFKWQPYKLAEKGIPQRDPYGVQIPEGENILGASGGNPDVYIWRKFPQTMLVCEDEQSPTIPLWEVFGGLDLEEDNLLSFANRYGQLGPVGDISNYQIRTVRRDPNPNTERGHIIRFGTVSDTLEFWKKEVAIFSLLLELDKGIENQDKNELEAFINVSSPYGLIGTNGEKTNDETWVSLTIDYVHQGQKVRLRLPLRNKDFLKIAGGHHASGQRNAAVDFVELGKVCRWDIVQSQLKNFPVQVSIPLRSVLLDLDNESEQKKKEDFPDVKVAESFVPDRFIIKAAEEGEEELWGAPQPVIIPGCLLGAMYWSFAQKLMNKLEYRRCAECGKIGYIGGKGSFKQMVLYKGKDWIHAGTEYERVKQRDYRERRRQERIARGEAIPLRGRPKKST